MSQKIFDATCYIKGYPGDATASTSSNPHNLVTAGDTLMIATSRAPATSGDPGNTGEMCWGPVTTLGFTTYYVFLCVAPNTWVRNAFTSF
jgi:hypothetical protein